MLYLLSELERWESLKQISGEQAAQLRSIYESRRDHLRDELAARHDEKLKQPQAQTGAAYTGQAQPYQSPPPTPPQPPARESEFVAFPRRPPATSSPPSTSPPPILRPQRTLLERLADPYTLRLLLYTGAAMLVVGVVIWLRDLLYLKLQEPVVQASLLALGTVAFTASGWYTILRTRQRWTGRALTLAGSLLFPVNFWFLVRSGLIENRGRAWVVCAFCTLLYASTAAILRERLYVYLASVASAATLWALIMREAPQAAALYALSLMTLSLLFLHLTQLFPAQKKAVSEPEEDEASESVGSRRSEHRWSRELWSVPLARMALAFAGLSLLLYMRLRFVTDETSFYDGIFRLRSGGYDPSIALLILAAAVYALWFAGRYVYMKWSAALYTTSALLFFLMALTACDGFRLSVQARLLALSIVCFLFTVVARAAARTPELSEPFRYASLITGIPLAILFVPVVLNADVITATHSAGLALVGASFAALSATRFGSSLERAALAHSAALYFSASYFVALASASFKSVTLNTALCVAWPLILFGTAELIVKLKRETQLSAPFTRMADAIIVLLLFWGSLLALVIHLTSDGESRSSSMVALCGVVIYGALRTFRLRSVYGAVLGTLAAVVLMAAILDALQKSGVWPASWPIAACIIVFAFLLERACTRLFRSDDETEASRSQPLLAAISIVLDSAVVVCALLWLIVAFTRINAGGFGAPSVLLLAFLYWVERASSRRLGRYVRAASAHMCAFLVALFIAFSVDPEWIVLLFALTSFPAFFILSRRWQSFKWLEAPLSEAAVAALSISLTVALIQAAPHLQAGDAHLLSPSLTAVSVALLSFAASIFSRGRASVLYFRAGLGVSVLALMLVSLRAGFRPLEDAEVYSTPIAVLLLIIAYLSNRRAWQEYDRDVGALLWAGSVLLMVPLLARALEFRLLLDSAAPWRDVAVLVAALALILYGVVGRMRAPVITGSVALITELAVLTLTTVDWLEVPLKYYLMTVGALLLIIFGTLEYRREQFLLMRRRFQQRRDSMREQFGEWR